MSAQTLVADDQLTLIVAMMQVEMYAGQDAVDLVKVNLGEQRIAFTLTSHYGLHLIYNTKCHKTCHNRQDNHTTSRVGLVNERCHATSI